MTDPSNPLIAARTELRAAIVLARDGRCRPAQAALHVLRGWELIGPSFGEERARWEALRTVCRARPDDWARTLSVLRGLGATDETSDVDAAESVALQIDWLARVIQDLESKAPTDRGLRRTLLGPIAVVVSMLMIALVVAPGGVDDLRLWRATFRTPEGRIHRQYFDAIDFDWQLGAPDSELPVDGFSARFETCIFADRATLTLVSDDGSRLEIDGQRMIDNWGDHSPLTKTSTVELSSGWHYLAIDYYEKEGSALLRFGAQGNVMYRPPNEDPDAPCAQ